MQHAKPLLCLNIKTTFGFYPSLRVEVDRVAARDAQVGMDFSQGSLAFSALSAYRNQLFERLSKTQIISTKYGIFQLEVCNIKY